MYTSVTTVIFLLFGHILLTYSRSSRFRSFIAEHEEKKPCAYRDDSGTTRVGAGFSLESKDTRTFFWTLGEDYDKFYHGKVTSKEDTCVCSRVPCLSKENLVLLFDMKIEEVLGKLEALIPSFDSLCFDVQKVIVDVGYSSAEDELQNFVKLIADDLEADSLLAVAKKLKRTKWCHYHDRRCSRNTKMLTKGCKSLHVVRNRRDVKDTTAKFISPSSCYKETMPVTDVVVTEGNQEKNTETPLVAISVKPELDPPDDVRTYTSDTTGLLAGIETPVVLERTSISAVSNKHNYREINSPIKPSHETHRIITDAGDYGDIPASTEHETLHVNKNTTNKNIGLIQASSSRSAIRHRLLNTEKMDPAMSKTVPTYHKSLLYNNSSTLRDTYQPGQVKETGDTRETKSSLVLASSTRSLIYTSVPSKARSRIIPEQRTVSFVLDTPQPSIVLQDSRTRSSVSGIFSRTDNSSVESFDNLRPLSSLRTPSMSEVSCTKIDGAVLFSSSLAVPRKITSNLLQIPSLLSQTVPPGKEKTFKQSSGLILHTSTATSHTISSIQRAVDRQETTFRRYSHSLTDIVMPKWNSSSSNLTITSRFRATRAVSIQVLPSEMVTKVFTKSQLASPIPTEKKPNELLPTSSQQSSSFLATSAVSIQGLQSEVVNKSVHRFVNFTHSSHITITAEKVSKQSQLGSPFPTHNYLTKRLLSASSALNISSLPLGKQSSELSQFLQVSSASHKRLLNSQNLSWYVETNVNNTIWKRSLFTTLVSVVATQLHNSANTDTTVQERKQIGKLASMVTASVFITPSDMPVNSTLPLAVKRSAAFQVETYLEQSTTSSASLINLLAFTTSPNVRASIKTSTASRKLQLSTETSDPRPSLPLTFSYVGLKAGIVQTTSEVEQTSPVFQQLGLTLPSPIPQPLTSSAQQLGQITSSALHQSQLIKTTLHQPLTSSELHRSQISSALQEPQPASYAFHKSLLTSSALRQSRLTSSSLIPQLLVSTSPKQPKLTLPTLQQTLLTSFAPHQSQQALSALHQSQPTTSVPHQPQLTSLAINPSQISASALQESSPALHQSQPIPFVPHLPSLTSLTLNQSQRISSALHQQLLTSSTLNGAQIPSSAVKQLQVESSVLHPSQLKSSTSYHPLSPSSLHQSLLASSPLNQSQPTSQPQTQSYALRQSLLTPSALQQTNQQTQLTPSVLNQSQPTSLELHQAEMTPSKPYQPQSAPYALHRSLLTSSELHQPLVTSPSLHQRSPTLYKPQASSVLNRPLLTSFVLSLSQLTSFALHQHQLTSSAPHQTISVPSDLHQSLVTSLKLQQPILTSSMLHKPQQPLPELNITEPAPSKIISPLLPSSLHRDQPLTTASLFSATPQLSVFKMSAKISLKVHAISKLTSSPSTLSSVIATSSTAQYFRSSPAFLLLSESTLSTTVSASEQVALTMTTSNAPALHSLHHFSSSNSLLLPTQSLEITASYSALQNITSKVLLKRTTSSISDTSASKVKINASLYPTSSSKVHATILTPSNTAEENYDETYLVTLRGHCNNVITNSNSFKVSFIEQLSMLLYTNESDVQCHSVICGSVKVTFTVRNARTLNTTRTLMRLMDRNSLKISFKGKVYSALQITAVDNPPTRIADPSPTSPTQVRVEVAISDIDKKRIKVIAFAAGGAFFLALFIVACVIFCARMCARPGSSAEFHVRNSLRSNEFEMKRFAPVVTGKKYYRKVDYYGDTIEEREEVRSHDSDTDEGEEREVNNSSTLLRNNYLNPSYRRVNSNADTGSQSSIFYY